MNPQLSSAIVTHLWQSTLFAAIVWLAALALRANSARVRYWLWTAASLKFLMPFSWLVAFGAAFQSRTVPAMVKPAAASVIADVLAPVTLAPVAAGTTATPTLAGSGWMLALVWLTGTVVVLTWWWRQWRMVRAAAMIAVPAELPPCCDTGGVSVMTSASAFEPGIVGIRRPVLLLPDGLLERLTPAQLIALIAHERCHLRCGDNFIAMLHMLVEAAFWFHPLVWWIERRMIDERERACDEAVLGSGTDPQDYAEGLLEVCRSSMALPLACVAGVSGSNLRRRIESILRGETGQPMTVSRRLALALAGVSLLSVPVLAGLTSAAIPLVGVGPEPDAPVFFEVASVRASTSGDLAQRIQAPPGGGFIATNAQLSLLIQRAYDISEDQLVNAPEWIHSARYDITARLDREPASPGRSQPDARSLALRSLLAERFKLAVHREIREFPIFALVMARGDRQPGPMLKPSSLDCSPEGMKARAAARQQGKPAAGGCGSVFNIGSISFGGYPLSEFAKVLSPYEERTVVDRTGLTGNWDFELRFTPDDVGQPAPGQDPPVIDPNGPSFVTALRDQLGLKLDPAKGPVEVLVVDRVERPADQ
jgi:uncharacterized protein (TIGR03435 family)